MAESGRVIQKSLVVSTPSPTLTLPHKGGGSQTQADDTGVLVPSPLVGEG
jgi:hypothetical protein